MRLFLERCRFFVSIKGRGKLRGLWPPPQSFSGSLDCGIFMQIYQGYRELKFCSEFVTQGCAEGRVAQDRQKIRIVLFRRIKSTSENADGFSA
jgi:hypothetical protein